VPELSIAAAFLLGLSSTLHCLGMCGGIVSALNLSVPDDGARRPLRRVIFASAFNAGRVLSYTIAGILAGMAGFFVAGAGYAYFSLQVLAAALLVLIGLHVGGWFTGLRMIESIGLRLWHLMQPLGRPFLPVDHAGKALMIGMIWGWLPCGLVYSALLWSMTRADPVIAGGAMFAFGLGTLPGMVGAGIAAGQLKSLRAGTGLRRAAGTVIIALGIVFLAIQLAAGPDRDHGSTKQQMHGELHH
jgi:sulfite exporter TauE/SafE